MVVVETEHLRDGTKVTWHEVVPPERPTHEQRVAESQRRWRRHRIRRITRLSFPAIPVPLRDTPAGVVSLDDFLRTRYPT